MIIKLGRYYYKLDGWASDKCYHNCKRFKDAFGYVLCDKKRHIIKESIKLKQVSDSEFNCKMVYSYKGAV